MLAEELNHVPKGNYHPSWEVNLDKGDMSRKRTTACRQELKRRLLNMEMDLMLKVQAYRQQEEALRGRAVITQIDEWSAVQKKRLQLEGFGVREGGLEFAVDYGFQPFRQQHYARLSARSPEYWDQVRAEIRDIEAEITRAIAGYRPEGWEAREQEWEQRDIVFCLDPEHRELAERFLQERAAQDSYYCVALMGRSCDYVDDHCGVILSWLFSIANKIFSAIIELCPMDDVAHDILDAYMIEVGKESQEWEEVARLAIDIE